VIRHTPRPVVYDVKGFREKNKDEVKKNFVLNMCQSKVRILRQIYQQQADSLAKLEQK
jgi:myosin heavy subunit